MKKVKSVEYILLSIILLFALIVRLYKVNSPVADWHSWRQADTASVSKIYQSEGISFLYPKYHDLSMAQTGKDNPEGYRFVEFPLYNAVSAVLASSFFGFSLEMWSRVVSIVFSLASIIFIFLIGKRYLGSIGGLLSGSVFAFMPFSVYFSRAILPESMAVSLGLAALWLFVLYSDNNSPKTLFLSAVLFALSILVKPFTIFYGIPMLYLAFKNNRTSRGIGIIQDKRLWYFLTLSLTPFILWRLWMLQFPEGIPHTKWAFNSDGIRFRPAFWRWIVGERLGKLMLGVWGVVPFSLGFLSSNSKKAFINWFLLGVFLFTSIWATANVRHDYYQVIAVPAVSLVLANGIIFLWNNKLFNSFVSRGVLFFSVGMMILVSYEQVKGNYQVNNFSIVEAGRRVQEISSEDSLVVAPYNKDTAFLYQTGRRGWPFVDGPIEDLMEKGADYYVSVNFDPLTLDVMESYNVIEQTEKYVIVRLSKDESN